MFCNDCGTRNSVDSKYCKECGAKVNDGYRTMMLTVEDLAGVEDDAGQQRLTRLLDMAFWHNEAGHTDAAIRAGEAALKIHPLCTTAHSLLGTLYEKKGEDAKAVQHFEEVVRLNPDSEADAAKLEQVRRGIHVKAVAQPVAYKWLPPALAGLGAGALSRPAPPVRLGKPGLVLVSGAAALLVLSAGWAAIKASAPPGPRVQTISSVPAPATPAPPPTSVPSAVGSAFAAPASEGPIAPVILRPRSVPGAKAALVAPQVTADGPFGEALPPGARTAPLVRTPRAARPARVATRRGVGGAGTILPALKISAVPLPSEGVPPMPIGGISSAPVAPMASVASLPQHTVVVSHLAGEGTSSPAPSLTPSFSGGTPDSSPPARISIHISRSPSSESISISDHSPPVRHTADAGGGDGDSYQQSALDLQNQGDFHHARAAYQKAIHAYKTQIASGRDAETAKRGLQASQTGLQICDQSQP